MEIEPKRKVFLFDLETSGLDANRGHILCASGKWLDEDWHYTWRIDDDENYKTTWQSWEYDKDIAVEIRDLCEEAHAVVAYYGGYMKFDVPYLNTRLMRWGETPCKQLTIVDPYTQAKSKLKLARNSMAAVAEILQIEDQKYHLPWDDWSRAQKGDRPSMTKLLEYCVNDIYTLQGIYLRMLPLFNNHPYVTPYTGDSSRCKACGGATYSKGWRYLKRSKVEDRVCKNQQGTCGWRGDGKREVVK